MAYTLRVRSAQNIRKLYSLEHSKLWHTLYEFAQLKIFEQLIRLAYIYLRKSFFFPIRCKSISIFFWFFFTVALRASLRAMISHTVRDIQKYQTKYRYWNRKQVHICKVWWLIVLTNGYIFFTCASQGLVNF